MTPPPIPIRSGPSGRVHLAGCRWFWAWAVIGAALALGLISFGVLALLPAAIVGAAIGRNQARRGSAWGLVTGFGLPLLLVASLNRAGPGTTCFRAATGSGCDQHLNPIPWLVVGLVLVLAGLLVQSRRAHPDR